MSVVFLSLLLIFELIQQASLVNFMWFSNISKILKSSFWSFWSKKLHISCVSVSTSQELFKAIFLSAKNNKKADRFCMKLSSTSNTVIHKGSTKGLSLQNISCIFLKLVYPTMVAEKFQISGVKIIGRHFLLMPLSKTLLRAEGSYRFPPNRVFWRSFFHPAEREEVYGAEKMTKVKLERVLVTSCDKFHHLCNLYIFGFCFVVP